MDYVTNEEEQALNAQSNLTDDSSIKSEALPGETDAMPEDTFPAVDKGASGTMDIKSEGLVENKAVSDEDIINGNPEVGAVTAYYEDGSEVILTENTDGTYLTGDGITYYLGEDGIYRSNGKPDMYVYKPQTPKEGSADAITEEQALKAIQKYCFANDPGLEEMMNSGDNAAYFDVSASDAGEIVVLYRSYTAAQIRYYINPSSGDVYVTELVPGIIDDEQRTDESFNIHEYLD